MTPPAADLRCTLTIPRPLAACFATPADLKTHLIAYGVWPDGIIQERWRLGIETPGWIVECEISVPMPGQQEGAEHGA